MRRPLRKGLSLVELMLGLAVVAVFVALAGSALGGGCGPVNTVKSVTSRYDVVGTVQGQVGSKMFAAGEGGETKFSVKIKTDSGPKVVNCTSTQCGTLADGDRVQFSCFLEEHFSEPDEEECRFDKLLPAQ